MPQDSASAQQSLELAGRVFTLAEANAALVFVKRVVADITHHYQRFLELRAQLEELSAKTAVADQVAGLTSQVQAEKTKLRELRAEFQEVGCELKDWSTGLVDFPAMLDGRMVLLCWKLGEPRITHWHESDAGFVGRQPVDDLFGTA